MIQRCRRDGQLVRAWLRDCDGAWWRGGVHVVTGVFTFTFTYHGRRLLAFSGVGSWARGRSREEAVGAPLSGPGLRRLMAIKLSLVASRSTRVRRDFESRPRPRSRSESLHF